MPWECLLQAAIAAAAGVSACLSGLCIEQASHLGNSSAFFSPSSMQEQGCQLCASILPNAQLGQVGQQLQNVHGLQHHKLQF